MNQLTDTCNQIESQLRVAQRFARNYGEALNQLGNLSVDSNGVDYILSIYDNNRERALYQLGKVFGVVGWTKEPNYSNNGYSWEREVDDVKVRILNAETLPPLVKQEVRSNEFPLLLNEDIEAEMEVL